MLMFFLGIVVFVGIILYTFVELMSMGRQQRQRPWRKIVLHSRFVISKLLVKQSSRDRDNSLIRFQIHGL